MRVLECRVYGARGDAGHVRGCPGYRYPPAHDDATSAMADLQRADTGLMYAKTVAWARRTLMRGFTKVRDMAGLSFGIKAATMVQAAKDRGTYVATHVYTAAGIRRALDASMRSIEHSHLADEATVRAR